MTDTLREQVDDIEVELIEVIADALFSNRPDAIKTIHDGTQNITTERWVMQECKEDALKVVHALRNINLVGRLYCKLHGHHDWMGEGLHVPRKCHVCGAIDYYTGVGRDLRHD